MSPESAPEPIPTPDGKEEAPDGNQGNRNSKERARRRSEKLEDSAPTGRPAPLAATAKEYDDKSGAPTPEPVKAIEVKQQPEYKELLERFEQSQATLHAVIEERDRLQTQFANERAESAKYKKDNALLRSEIVEMTRAREPLREESFFIGQFNEMSADIESWAARETRRAPLEKIPKPDMAKLGAEFPKYGPHGIETAKWFSKQNSKFVQDRRNRIALIRHSLAIVLLDRILDLFIFGFPRDLSNNFAGVEKWICMKCITSPRKFANPWKQAIIPLPRYCRFDRPLLLRPARRFNRTLTHLANLQSRVPSCSFASWFPKPPKAIWIYSPEN